MSMNMEHVKMPVKSVQEYDKAVKPAEAVKPEKVSFYKDNSGSISVDNDEDKALKDGREPSKGTIESAFSDMNSKLKMQRTRCEYNYDDVTRRVSIKVYDKDTDELVLETPPEDSIEALKKTWELAGIIVDEKF